MSIFGIRMFVVCEFESTLDLLVYACMLLCLYTTQKEKKRKKTDKEQGSYLGIGMEIDESQLQSIVYLPVYA